MKRTISGKDVISIDENNVEKYKQELSSGVKFHIIKLNFDNPTVEKVENVVSNFTNTNRFIISNNIRFYNGHLKHVGKKYYIENTTGDSFISFVRKNNKILCNFVCMAQAESRFLLENYLQDILNNCEIIIINEMDLATYANILKAWTGNVIVHDPDYVI